MSRVIIDLAAKRQGASSTGPLEHPAGVTLPFDNPSDAALIIPEIRSEIRSGSYAADVLQLLPNTVQFGDRALIIGAGLGVMSTLVARSEGIERVIAVEANTSLIPYLNRVHDLNKVSEIETVNAVLADGKKGRVPFFARRDLRTSSLVPHDRSWQQVMMVPFMDLNLILKEERISLIICDIPVTSAQLLARAELDTVERILVNCCDDADQAWDEDGVCTLLAARGYASETVGTAVLFHRPGASDRAAGQPGKVMTSSNEKTAADDMDIPADDQFDDQSDDQFPGEEQAEEEPAGEEPAGDLQTDDQPAGDQQTDERKPGARQDGGIAAHETNGSRAGRLWWLVALSLFMALPLILISEIANNRAGRQVTVAREIAAAWGGAQTLTGPFIVIPVETRGDGARAAPLVLLPEVLKIDSELSTELLRRGVFEVPVYRGRHEIWLDIDPARITGGQATDARGTRLLAADEVVLWEEAALGLGIAEPRTLRGRLLLDSGTGGGDAPAGFESGAFGPGMRNLSDNTAPMAGVHVPIGDPRARSEGWSFTLELDGSQQFRLTPAGGVTDARMRSDWPQPRFSGVFRPARRVTGEAGFEAEWSIPQLAHSLPRAFRGTGQLGELQGAGFGVDLLPPMDIYQIAQRAVKYGLLLIAMTFGAIFLMEKLATRRPHVAQYALIGTAQCVFFALLVSLAEQVGFGLAYGLAAVATIALLTAYAWFALRLGPRSGWLTMALGLLYVVVYLILSSEGQALLMGAVLAFLAVAATMWGTRNEDWSVTFGKPEPKPAAQGPNG
jgi:inner membrane protein